MAPQKTLVDQQKESCIKITNSWINSSEISQMTGDLLPRKRKIEWENKRIFFVTPQIVVNDIESGFVPVKEVVCIIVDEAHRSQGKYAFVPVISEIKKVNVHFRVVALTATPGCLFFSLYFLIFNIKSIIFILFVYLQIFYLQNVKNKNSIKMKYK